MTSSINGVWLFDQWDSVSETCQLRAAQGLSRYLTLKSFTENAIYAISSMICVVPIPS